jgi:hypothetical protein
MLAGAYASIGTLGRGFSSTSGPAPVFHSAMNSQFDNSFASSSEISRSRTKGLGPRIASGR